MISLVSYLLLAVTIAIAQAPPSTAQPQQETAKQSPLSPPEVSQLQNRAEAGDATAQFTLGRAYKNGNGIPQSDSLALMWFRKAADQGDAAAENNIGNMYRFGEAVPRDKVEAARWYAKGAKHGCAEAMFNLGASYYNGDGVASNEFTAYAWFLLAQDAGDSMARDAVQRSAATLSPTDKAGALMQIATMYEKGDQLPKSEEQMLRWLREAAEINSPAKVRLAVHLLSRPDAPQYYGQALDLCKAAAKDYSPGFSCVGYIHRKGLGVTQDSAEAVKWYQKGVAASNPASMLALAEMYSVGEGTKVDRPAAFVLLLRAYAMGISDAKKKASQLLGQMDKSELKRVERTLWDQKLDPKKVFAEMQDTPSS